MILMRDKTSAIFHTALALLFSAVVTVADYAYSLLLLVS
jgi:hypothetical protein